MKVFAAVIAFVVLCSSNFANAWGNGLDIATDLVQSHDGCNKVISNLVAPAIANAAAIGPIEMGPGCGEVGIASCGTIGVCTPCGIACVPNTIGVDLTSNVPCNAWGWGPSALGAKSIC